MFRVLDLELTTRCNLSCTACFVREFGRSNRDLPAKTAVAAIKESVELGNGTVHLTGGEPACYPCLDEVVEGALESGIKVLFITTNGLVATLPALLAQTSARCDLHVSVSIDGPKAIHESIRGAGSYDAVRGQIETISSLCGRFSVNTNITPQLVEGLPEWVDHVLESYPTLDHLTLFINSGSHAAGAPAAIAAEELERIADLISPFMRDGRNVRIAGYPIMNLLLERRGVGEEYYYHCRVGDGRFTIAANGDIQLCHPTYYSLGHFPATSLASVMRRHEYDRFRTHDFEGCRNCLHRVQCGNCRAYVLHRTGDVWGNDWVCSDFDPSLDTPHDEVAT